MKFPRKPGLPDVGSSGSSRDEDEPAGTLSIAGARISAAKPQARRSSKRGYLDGQMLIAMPTMGDERFARSVIYVCAHSTEGAMGIIVNQPAANIKFPDLLVQLEVIPSAERIELPNHEVKVLKGGPVET